MFFFFTSKTIISLYWSKIIQDQRQNISDLEIASAYFVEEKFMEDATIIANNSDKEFVEYFVYVVRKENL